VPKPKSTRERGVWHSVPQNENSVKKNAYKELLSSKSSLQQAFILKEILGKPVSLRPRSNKCYFCGFIVGFFFAFETFLAEMLNSRPFCIQQLFHVHV
jgi:hypothetical protein